MCVSVLLLTQNIRALPQLRYVSYRTRYRNSVAFLNGVSTVRLSISFVGFFVVLGSRYARKLDSQFVIVIINRHCSVHLNTVSSGSRKVACDQFKNDFLKTSQIFSSTKNHSI